jgi:hypothetical protein
LLGELDVLWVSSWDGGGVSRVWGKWLDGVSWVPSSGGVWGWGHSVVDVVVVVVWSLWVVSKTGLGSGDITSGGIWSSGNWVGVVMWDGGDLLLDAWGTGWAILWSVSSSAGWGGTVDTERTVVSVAVWEGSGSGSNSKSSEGEFHYYL